MHDEAEVGLVEAHAERGGGDQRLDPVGEQVLLGLRAARRPRSGRCSDATAMPAAAQERGDLLGGGDGQRVDDAGARAGRRGGRRARPAGAPASGSSQHGQAQRLAVERAAQHQRVVAGRRAARRRRRRPARWRWRWSRAPGVPAGSSASSVRSAGSRAGSRGPSRRCSAPRRPRAARRSAASWGSTSSRKPGLLSRSGLTSSTSTSPRGDLGVDLAATRSTLVELMVPARMPARAAASTWLRISASSGQTITVGPAPRARSSAVATK